SAMLTRHDLFADSPEASYSLHPYQFASHNPVNWNDPSRLLVDDPEVDENTGITNYQLTPEEMHLAAFSYSSVVGSPGIVFDDVRVWASANGILHTQGLPTRVAGASSSHLLLRRANLYPCAPPLSSGTGLSRAYGSEARITKRPFMPF
ncbi:MAG: hypothetical protein MI924_32720, partial [Chloroflexales bacterium]|nr:hypothetical protein [Chloroflexales bacterium]